MVRFVRGVLGVFIVVILTVVSISNIHDVSFSYNPTLDNAVMLPAYALILGGFFVGFSVGALVMWLNTWSKHTEQKKYIHRLEAELKTFEGSEHHKKPRLLRSFKIFDKSTQKNKKQEETVEL